MKKLEIFTCHLKLYKYIKGSLWLAGNLLRRTACSYKCLYNIEGILYIESSEKVSRLCDDVYTENIKCLLHLFALNVSTFFKLYVLINVT